MNTYVGRLAQLVCQYSLGDSVLVAELGSLLHAARQLVKDAKFHLNIPKPGPECAP